MDSVGFHKLPDTSNLTVSLCQRQAYDEAVNMMRRSQDLVWLQHFFLVTVAVHSCIHSLNLFFRTLEDSFHVFSVCS